ncbi:unnamed protein product [Clavelina lepadiformis]|uniref:Uncharacterized protein n=1 Tax=Clavelina lepadiformis TaxID=159417 RepID=A0ABP0GMY7_CLALP
MRSLKIILLILYLALFQSECTSAAPDTTKKMSEHVQAATNAPHNKATSKLSTTKINTAVLVEVISSTVATTKVIGQTVLTTKIEATKIATSSTIDNVLVKSSKVPNPEVGVTVVTIFLVIVAVIVVTWITFLACRHRRRMYYRQPSRNSRLRQEGEGFSDFHNPIQFPSAAYDTSSII